MPYPTPRRIVFSAVATLVTFACGRVAEQQGARTGSDFAPCHGDQTSPVRLALGEGSGTFTNVTSVRPATLNVPAHASKSSACGISFRADLCKSAGGHCRHVFVKTSVAWPEHAEGEMHVREVLVAKLDQILGTDLVPRTEGRLVRLANLSDATTSEQIRAATMCARPAATDGSGGAGAAAACDDCIGASVMDWDPSAQPASLEEMKLTPNWLVFAAFLYLAGCAKSGSSFFKRQGAEAGMPSPIWGALAIDNDRCFLSSTAEWDSRMKKALMSATSFERVVFDRDAVRSMASYPTGAALLSRLERLGPAEIVLQLVQRAESDGLASELKAYLKASFVGPTLAARRGSSRCGTHRLAGVCGNILQEFHDRLTKFYAFVREANWSRPLVNQQEAAAHGTQRAREAALKMVEDELKHRDVVCSSTTGKLSMDIGGSARTPPKWESARTGLDTRQLPSHFPNLTVRIDGSDVMLHASLRTNLGTTSVRWMNDRYVLKIGVTKHRLLAARDACVLRLMSGGSSAPRMLCDNALAEGALLTEHAGRPLTIHNIPRDYRKQAEAILEDMSSRGIAHHDLFKADASSAFKVEFLVDSVGKMRVVDFGTASVNGSFRCEVGMIDSIFKTSHGPYNASFPEVQDLDVLSVLDAMHRANQSMESYSAAGIVAQVGVCNYDNAFLLLHSQDTIFSLAKLGGFGELGLEQNAVSSHDFEVGRAFRFQSGRSVHPGHSLPNVADVLACVEQCRRHKGCTSVSVSTSRHACFWFARPCTQSFGELHSLGIYNRATDNRTFLTWLDDFATVAVK